MLSGIAGTAMPRSVAETLELGVMDGRGTAEIRAGLGGTYAALGGWALLSSQPTADIAVGVTWLGAASARLASLALDRPRTPWPFWAYLGVEIGLGAVALSSGRRAAAASW